MAEIANHDEQHIMSDLSKPRTPMEYLRLFFSGFAMGASDIVPGVSGGTMAFILGVYETLLNAIKSFNLDALGLVMRFLRPADDNHRISLMTVVDNVYLRFLIPLGLGLLTALIALSSLLEGWILTNPTYIFAFFGGLIIASVIAIGAKVRWNTVAIVSLIVGALIAFLITNPALGTLGDVIGHGPLALFISGAIAICAMILPGISGSFILLILGQYEFILGALRGRDIGSLLFVAMGALLGILIFSRILSWLLNRYENSTIALLVGFMLGSMRLIVYRMSVIITESEIGEDVVTAVDMNATLLLGALGFAIVGFLLVSFIDHMQSRSNPLLGLVLGRGDAPVAVRES